MPKIANPSVPALYEDALVYESGSAITSSGALTAYSGAKTGRSPLDKRIVKEENSEKDIWWGPVNKPMSPQVSAMPFCLMLRVLFEKCLRTSPIIPIGIQMRFFASASAAPRIEPHFILSRVT